MTYYQHYRLSTVGICLEEALEELKEKNIFTEAEVDMIRTKFDRAMAECLSSDSVDKQLTLKGSLHHYRFCDNVWQLFVKDAEVKFDKKSEFTYVGPLKVIACDFIKPAVPKPT
ncbi:hypothetical protein GpartN1_g4889.t1 [Galdieria partita]|uniref:Transcription initiation factor IIA subunit 2 n=1 Tax=Galdieria partita TaxID=83374 RepID=A0A9C7PYG8_9RHOD|nr:hypothetical protein GpartN1_g4889.t1 [Galdieria partita]